MSKDVFNSSISLSLSCKNPISPSRSVFLNIRLLQEIHLSPCGLAPSTSAGSKTKTLGVNVAEYDTMQNFSMKFYEVLDVACILHEQITLNWNPCHDLVNRKMTRLLHPWFLGYWRVLIYLIPTTLPILRATLRHQQSCTVATELVKDLNHVAALPQENGNKAQSIYWKFTLPPNPKKRLLNEVLHLCVSLSCSTHHQKESF